METATIVFFAFAATCNCVVAILNVRQARRGRRLLEDHTGMVAKLLAFAAFMSRPESGAPEHVRNLARQALPEDIRIEVANLGPISATKH